MPTSCQTIDADPLAYSSKLSDFLGGVMLLTLADKSAGLLHDSMVRRRIREIPEDVRRRLETTVEL